jgi:sec-independent protein translocase protein TatA
MLGNIGPLEIGVVLVIALLVFGPKRLPELGSGLGRGMREFKDGVTGTVETGTEAQPGEADPGAVAVDTVVVPRPSPGRTD